MVILFLIALITTTIILSLAENDIDIGRAGSAAVFLLLCAVWITEVWAGLAVTVKRWHDRDKSGAWMLVVAIPLVGQVWAFIEIALMRGTVGPNRFGPDSRRRR